MSSGPLIRAAVTSLTERMSATVTSFRPFGPGEVITGLRADYAHGTKCEQILRSMNA
jgi:hypothetical protein